MGRVKHLIITSPKGISLTKFVGAEKVGLKGSLNSPAFTMKGAICNGNRMLLWWDLADHACLCDLMISLLSVSSMRTFKEKHVIGFVMNMVLGELCASCSRLSDKSRALG